MALDTAVRLRETVTVGRKLHVRECCTLKVHGSQMNARPQQRLSGKATIAQLRTEILAIGAFEVARQPPRSFVARLLCLLHRKQLVSVISNCVCRPCLLMSRGMHAPKAKSCCGYFYSYLIQCFSHVTFWSAKADGEHVVAESRCGN